MFRTKRDWSKSTISKAHDTRELTRRGGGHGNVGSLTFSFSLQIGEMFLKKFCNGNAAAHVRLELQGRELLIAPARAGEFGRKIGLSSGGKDYRAFFDGSNYKWIEEIKPFGATPAETRLTDRGIVMVMPDEKDRNPIEPYTSYNPRYARPPRVPAPQRVPVKLEGPVQELLPMKSDSLYLVMVPAELDEKFHTLLKFLKLEALKE